MKLFKILLVSISLTGLSTAAFAQGMSKKNKMTAPQQEISKEDKASFDKVYPEVVKLAQKRMKKIQGAEKDAEKKRINTKYSRMITEEIRDAGLTVNQFNSLARAKAQAQ